MDAMGIMDYIHMGASMADMPKVMKEYGSIDLAGMSARFKHPALKALFTDYLPKEYVASSFLVSYASIASGNGEIPTGGSLAMVNRMVAQFQRLGGNLYCNAPVSRILIEKEKSYDCRRNGKNRGRGVEEYKTAYDAYHSENSSSLIEKMTGDTKKAYDIYKNIIDGTKVSMNDEKFLISIIGQCTGQQKPNIFEKPMNYIIQRMAFL